MSVSDWLLQQERTICVDYICCRCLEKRFASISVNEAVVTLSASLVQQSTIQFNCVVLLVR